MGLGALVGLPQDISLGPARARIIAQRIREDLLRALQGDSRHRSLLRRILRGLTAEGRNYTSNTQQTRTWGAAPFELPRPTESEPWVFSWLLPRSSRCSARIFRSSTSASLMKRRRSPPCFRCGLSEGRSFERLRPFSPEQRGERRQEPDLVVMSWLASDLPARATGIVTRHR